MITGHSKSYKSPSKSGNLNTPGQHCVQGDFFGGNTYLAVGNKGNLLSGLPSDRVQHGLNAFLPLREVKLTGY